MKHLSADMLDRFRRRELLPAEIVAVATHLHECSSCASTAVDREVQAVSSALLERDDDCSIHMAPDHIVSYVDGELGAAEREVAETHLNDCAMCRAEVDDLQLLARSQKSRRWVPRLGVVAASALLVVSLLMLMQRSDVNAPPSGAVTEERPRHGPESPATRSVAAVRRDTRPTAAPRRPEWEQLVSEAVASQRLPFPKNLESLRPPFDEQRASEPNGGTAGRLAPAGIVVADARPLFTWEKRRDATYVVSVFEGRHLVTASSPLRETRWRTPHVLAPGKTYSWQVEVRTTDGSEVWPAPPAPEARFRVLAPREREELQQARLSRPDDHLLLAVLYARSGLEKEAVAELRLAAANAPPEAAPLLRRYAQTE